VNGNLGEQLAYAPPWFSDFDLLRALRASVVKEFLCNLCVSVVNAPS